MENVINGKIVAVILAVGLLLTFANSLFWGGEKMDPECKYYYSQGATYFQDGQYAKAIQAFLEVIRRNPNYSTVYYHLGLSYDAAGKPFLAVDAYKQAVAINPRYTSAYFSLGNVYDVLGNFREAVICYEIVIKLNPQSPEAYYNLGVDYRHMRRPADATEMFEKARELFERRKDPEGVSRVDAQLSMA